MRLKSGWGIAEAIGHDQELIMAFMSTKNSFGYICLFHLDLIETQMKVEFGEEFGTMPLI